VVHLRPTPVERERERERVWSWWTDTGGGHAPDFKQPTWPYDIERGPGGLTREVETPSPSNSPNEHMILRVNLGGLTREVETPSPSNSPHEHMILRVALVNTAGRPDVATGRSTAQHGPVRRVPHLLRRGSREQVRFCRDRLFPTRRLRIQGGQGRGRFGYRFTVQLTLVVNSKILLLIIIWWLE
jgi:hypothetical protein